MTRRIGGADRASRSVVTKMKPPTIWAVHGIDGPISALVDVTVQALDEARSSVSIDVAFQGHGFGKLLVPLVVRRQAAKEMPANVARLKDRLESTQFRTCRDGRVPLFGERSPFGSLVQAAKSDERSRPPRGIRVLACARIDGLGRRLGGQHGDDVVLVQEDASPTWLKLSRSCTTAQSGAGANFSSPRD
jgi:hypothetical protein